MELKRYLLRGYKGTVGYKIRYAFGAVTEKSGSKKSAAKVLQQGKNQKRDPFGRRERSKE